MSEARNIVDQYPMEQMVAGTPQTSVYRSTDPATGEAVSVKIISSLGSGSAQLIRQHFLRAMGAVQFLQLPAFPEILDFGFTEDDAAFMVMRWVDASPISGLRGESPGRILPIFLQMIEALEALAMGQVHHLNLSPENILFSEGEEGESVVLLGFGTSIYLTGSQAGAMMGHSPESDAYMAPERLDPQTADGADGSLADLYSLSLILAEMLGASFEGDGRGNRLVAFPEDLRLRAPGITKLEGPLSSALRLDPKQRESSFPLLKKVLQDLIGELEASAAQAKTRILSPEELRAATAEIPDDDGGFETRIHSPEEMPSDSLELGGEAFELDLPQEEDVPLPPEEDVTAELPVMQASELEAEEVSPTMPLPKADPEAAQFDIGETTPTPKFEVSQGHESAEPAEEQDLDDTDPGVFDPNETNPALDPGSIGAEPAPPAPSPPSMPPPLPKTPPPVGAPPEAPGTVPVSPEPPPSGEAADVRAPAPPAPPAPPTPAPPSPAGKAPVPGGARASSLRKWLLIGAAAGLFLVLIVALLLVRSCRREPVVQPTVVVEMAPTPTPLPVVEEEGAQMHPVLQQTGALLETGDIAAARDLIGQLSPEEIAAFSEEEKQNYEGILQAVQGSALDAAISDLEGGLKHGSIPMLKRAVAAFRHLDSSEYRDRKGVSGNLRRARDILKLHADLWKAQKGGDHRKTLELAGKMIKALPGYSGAYTFRDEAASGIEQTSETALKQKNFRLASQILEPIEEFYPGRKGLKARLDAIRVAELRYQKQKTQLDDARAKGAAGHPELGLKILAGLSFDGDLKAEAQGLEKSLKAQLEQMDANPPTISPVPGQELAYKKKKSMTLKFRISDDLEVKNATILLRFEGAGSFIRKSLESRSDGSWAITIGPSMHHNGDFSFYVEARDRSDHVGRLGSAAKPLKVKRKKGLKALFGK